MLSSEIIKKSCIYCGKTDKETTFKRREHVMPVLMGSFINGPTIRDWVCDDCNGNTFNKLETVFKEDTHEGIFCQMYNLDDNYQIRIRGKNTKAVFSPNFGTDFFKNIFPVFGMDKGERKAFFPPQIRIKRGGEGGYVVLLVEKLKNIRGTKKFRKLQKALAGVISKDVMIFAGANFENDRKNLGEAIGILKELGIEYKEGRSKYVPISDDGEKRFEIEMNGKIERDAGRVIAKVAFNYFAYCAIRSGKPYLLFDPKFSKIKKYILGEIDPPIKEIITGFDNEPFIYEEKMAGKRIIAHFLMFYGEKGDLIGKVTFFGLHNYTINLGTLPDELRNNPGFGSAHLFNPFTGEIGGMTQNPAKRGSGIEIGFGLFNRI